MSRTITLTNKEALALSLSPDPLEVHSVTLSPEGPTFTLTDQEAEGLLRLTEKMLRDHPATQEQAPQAVWQSLRDRLVDALHTPDPEPPP